MYNVGCSCSVIWSAVGGRDVLRCEFYFPLLFMRSGWGTIRWVDATVDWLVFYLIFISIAVLRLGLKGSVDFNSIAPCDGSEVVNCNSVVVDRYIVALICRFLSCCVHIPHTQSVEFVLNLFLRNRSPIQLISSFPPSFPRCFGDAIPARSWPCGDILHAAWQRLSLRIERRLTLPPPA